jgi:pyridoxal phosphate enzyme (YggS family)
VDEILVTGIRTRARQVRERIAAAARRGGRDPDSVRLVVVTKAQPLEVVRAAAAAGMRILGENYPEEAVTKIESMKNEFDVEWHMIGHVQSRKAELVARDFTMLHSLDSLKLAQRLENFCAEAGRTLPVLLEFNVGAEESKFGFPAWEERLWPDLMPALEPIMGLSHLRVAGLMTMPPFFEEAESSRPYFQRLRRLRDCLAGRFPSAGWKELSMGTSVDYEVAVEEGATYVRVGTAIVGPRPPKS